MRKTVVVLLLVLLGLVSSTADGAVHTLFTARTATGASDKAETGGSATVTCDVWRSDSTSASTAVVYLQQSNNGTYWFTVATVTNPTGLDGTTGAGGERWVLAPAPYTRAFLYSRTTGSISTTCAAPK